MEMFAFENKSSNVIIGYRTQNNVKIEFQLFGKDNNVAEGVKKQIHNLERIFHHHIYYF